MRTTRLAPAVLGRVIGALLAVAVLVAGTRVLHSPAHKMVVTAVFDRAGLNVRPGYEVRVRDYPVGTISDITVDRKTFNAVYTLKRDPGTAVARDTHAVLVPKTLFGDKYVQLDPAAPGQPELQNGDRIGLSETQDPVEIQQVFDETTPLLQALDPPRFGAALASISQGLAGEGDDLRRLTDGWTAVMQEFANHTSDLQTLLTTVPGVAGTFADRSQDLTTAADDLGQVAAVLAKNEPSLGPLLQQNAELADKAADLLSDQPARLGQIIPDMVDVVALTDSMPGRIAKFAKSVKYNLRGTANIMSSGWIQTRVTNTFILNWGTIYDAPGQYGDYNGGTGVTPDIDVTGVPNKNVPVNLSPSQKAASATGLNTLLAPLTGGGQ
ncbi:MAG: MCE family protein [Acidimicrobiia bacterium]|nr:MCE family protein [Acidimicrobiia bacterium]